MYTYIHITVCVSCIKDTTPSCNVIIRVYSILLLDIDSLNKMYIKMVGIKYLSPAVEFNGCFNKLRYHWYVENIQDHRQDKKKIGLI